MTANLYRGEVTHQRLHPVQHKFVYPIYFMSVDLDELATLGDQQRLFSHNTFNLLSIHDKDYLQGQGTLWEKLKQCLKQAEKPYEHEITNAELLTMPRYMNYGFNPVSFFYCYDDNRQLVCVVVEVNNTFGERHIYFLDEYNQRLTSSNKLERNEDEGIVPQPHMQFDENKTFHVSPFNSMQGNYRFIITSLVDQLDIHINLQQRDDPILTTHLHLKELPFTSSSLFIHLLKLPFTASIAMPRIMWQAAKLHYLKGLTVQMKPNPSSPMTISTSKPSALMSWRMRMLFGYLDRLKLGFLTLVLPDHNEKTFGDAQSDFKVTVNVHDYSFFTKVMKGGDIGLGESYMQGDWSSNHLTDVFTLFLINRPHLDYANVKRNWVTDVIYRFKHILKRNNLTGSRKNIQAHYDLSNDFFEAFLDESMTYSCGIFEDSTQTLEQAQINKMQAVIKKAEIGPEDHVLEIGSGWGSFAVEAVKTTGCRVTSITLSEEQLKYAREKVEREGLTDRIQFELIDYRHVQGTFDKIVSIEMFEAVGHEYYGQFFKTCDRLLKPNGKVVMQVITIADQFYDTYRRTTDWIQAYIFPGGVLPSLTAMTQAMTKDSKLVVDDVENIGLDYARTMQAWRERFFEKVNDIEALGFDDMFVRMWEYYLCYSEAGFLSRQIGDYQLVMSRPNEPTVTPSNFVHISLNGK